MEKTDAEKLIGAFALAISANMPEDLAERIATNLDQLAREMLRHEGRTRTQTLCTDLAATIRAAHPASH